MEETIKRYKFFFDESGQDGSKPFVVVGGIGFEEAQEENIKNDILALYKYCFGVSLESEKHELKGSGLLKRNRIENASKFPIMDDEMRQHHAGLVLSNSPQVKANITAKDLAGFGQAGILFVKELFPILKKHNCIIVFARLRHDDFIVMQKEFKKNRRKMFDKIYLKHSVSAILRKMEFRIYQALKALAVDNHTTINIKLDSVEESLDKKRMHTFRNAFLGLGKNKKPLTLREFTFKQIEHHKQSLGDKYSVEFVDSKAIFMIQIADIISFIASNYSFGAAPTKLDRDDLNLLMKEINFSDLTGIVNERFEIGTNNKIIINRLSYLFLRKSP